MEQKMTTISFDVELAKKIQAGEHQGKIITDNLRDVRIVCWDRKSDNDYPYVALINDGKSELIRSVSLDGVTTDKTGILLKVPEWTQFKDCDVVYCDTTDGRGDKYIWIAVIKELFDQDQKGISIDFYFSIDIEGKDKGKSVFDGIDHYADYVRLANEEEKQQLIDALKQSTDPRAKEYLKRFFCIEEKKEYKFEPFQKVLVRFEDESPWEASLFSHIGDKEDEPFNTVGGINYAQCIPYNDQTKHLLGTTDNWEG